VVCDIETEKFLFLVIFFTNVVFPAPEGDERIYIPPFLKLDIQLKINLLYFQ
jgi:hypothetical protein